MSKITIYEDIVHVCATIRNYLNYAIHYIKQYYFTGGYFILFCSDKYKAEKYGFFSQSLDKRAKEFTDKELWVEIIKESIHHFDMYNADVTVFKKN